MPLLKIHNTLYACINEPVLMALFSYLEGVAMIQR